MVARAEGVSKSYGTKTVFQNVSVDIEDGDRVGIIGENGGGKSTLFRIFAGVEKPDAGSIVLAHETTVGYLEQEPHLHMGEDETVFDVAMSSTPAVVALLRTIRKLEVEMASVECQNDPERFSRVLDIYGRRQEEFDQVGGYQYETKVRAVLGRIGFAEQQLQQKVRSLSGGEKKILGLVQLLVREPALILLDEPDNHLDLEAKEWLEQYIKNHRGAVAVISHDRYFLDRFVNRIVELEDGRVYEYRCNYSGFREEKQKRLERETMQYELQKRQLKELEKSAKQLSYWASLNNKLAGRAKNRKRLVAKKREALASTIRPVLNRPTIQLSFKEVDSGRSVLQTEGLSMTYGSRTLFAPFDVIIGPGERVALLGPNGSGKTTLFRIIMGIEKPSAGSFKLGANVKIGYYSQEHEVLPLDMSPVHYIRSVKPMPEENAVAMLVSKLQFEYEQCFVPIRSLSGGQRNRLLLAQLGLAGVNLLLLDEPTNNLDIPSMIVLEDALLDYEGTVLVISHDRYFLDQVADRILYIQNGLVGEFLGTFSDFYSTMSGKIDIGFSGILRSAHNETGESKGGAST